MAEVRVTRNSQERLGRVDGDLRCEANVHILTDATVSVSGEARFDGAAEVGGNLECARFRSDDGTVIIAGNLTVLEDIASRDGTLEVRGTLKAQRVDVDRRLRVGGAAE